MYFSEFALYKLLNCNCNCNYLQLPAVIVFVNLKSCLWVYYLQLPAVVSFF